MIYRILVAFILGIGFVQAQNLITNGDFESGVNVGYQGGQNPGYQYMAPPLSGTTSAGDWTIHTNPQDFSTNSFVSIGDHTTGTANMMMIDGTNTGGAQRFYRAGTNGSGVCGLTVGQTYTFSYWIHSIYGNVSGNPTPANIGVQINNSSNVQLVFGSTIAPQTSAGWQQVVYTFTANNSCVNIELWNNNTAFEGNDFAIDDISLTTTSSTFTALFSKNDIRCTGETGLIAVYPYDGIPPYTFNLTGPVNQTNTNGVFNNLPEGSYQITITDSNFPAVTENLGTIEINDLTPAPVSVTPTTSSICAGESVELTASGGNGNYVWSPMAGLNTFTGSTVTASPTSTTTYTVSEVDAPSNLITNGDFENGYASFGTDYNFLPVNPTGAQGIFTVANNPQNWFAPFTNFTETNMLLVDGSTSNGGTDRVWFQTVKVTPNTLYTFRYRARSIAPENPAVLITSINGSNIGSGTLPSNTANWQNITYNWNSGSNTTATILLRDNNTLSFGNDFALDDIRFEEQFSCNTFAQSTITVTEEITPTFDLGDLTFCTGEDVPELPTTSEEGITGTWNPSSISNTTSGTYLFTPDGGQNCVGNAEIPVTIHPPITPGVTIQPTDCDHPTGSITFLSPLNSFFDEIFISEITDHSSGSTSYIELFNGTENPVDLSEYEIRVYHGGNSSTSNIDVLSGTVNPNETFVIKIGCESDVGGVTPDYVSTICNAVNNNDNIRLYHSGTLIDTWGTTDGTVFTPNGERGYTYRRLNTILGPNPVFAPSEWQTFDPEVYDNVGDYTPLSQYEYSVDGGNTYQNDPFFGDLTPGNYSYLVRDMSTGCTSAPVPITLLESPEVVTPTFDFGNELTYCENQTAVTLPTTSNNNISGTWSPANIDTSIVGQNQSYTFTPNDGECATNFELTVNVEENIEPSFSFGNALQYCQNETPVNLPTTSANGISGTWSPLTIDSSTVGTQTYTFEPDDGICADDFNLEVEVIDEITPTFSFGNSLSYCLNETDVQVLPSTSANGVTGTWSPAVINTSVAGIQNYVFTPNSSACAITPPPLQVTVTAPINPTFSFGNSLSYCAGETDVQALPTTSANGVTGTWSPSIIDTSIVGANQIYTFTPNDGECALPFSLGVTINPTQTPEFDEFDIYCIGDIPDELPTTSNNGFTGTWSPAAIDTSVAGTRTYEFTPDDTANCIESVEIEIDIFAPPTIVQVIIENSSLQVIATGGNAPYEYSIDMAETWQSSNQFFNLPIGTYTIWVRGDELDCYTETTALLFNLTNVITPNDDGINDVWDASGLMQYEGAEVEIFDRYGKIIATMNAATGFIWDGKYLGRNLPTTTYWYTLRLGEGEEKQVGWIQVKNR